MYGRSDGAGNEATAASWSSVSDSTQEETASLPVSSCLSVPSLLCEASEFIEELLGVNPSLLLLWRIFVGGDLMGVEESRR